MTEFGLYDRELADLESLVESLPADSDDAQAAVQSFAEIEPERAMRRYREFSIQKAEVLRQVAAEQLRLDQFKKNEVARLDTRLAWYAIPLEQASREMGERSDGREWTVRTPYGSAQLRQQPKSVEVTDLPATLVWLKAQEILDAIITKEDASKKALAGLFKANPNLEIPGARLIEPGRKLLVSPDLGRGLETGLREEGPNAED